MREVESQRHALAALGAPEPPVVHLHPKLIDERKAALREFGTPLQSDEATRAEFSAQLRRIVASIEVRPNGRRGKPDISVRSIISELLGLPAGNEPGTASPHVTVGLAEGMGFEPTIGVFPL
jgi:hypothetical protein